MTTLDSQTRIRSYEEASVSYQPSHRLKQAIDLAICIALLPVMLIVIPGIAILIALDSPGSPFFLQERVGLDGRRFRLYKFRTLRCNHDDQHERTFMKAYVSGKVDDAHENFFKPIQKKDITRVGRLLRKASLDELPQLFNVIKGEMSLIGPRPNVPWEVEAYKSWHYERLAALPGITGLAQVMGRSNLSFDQIALYDIHYVRNQSLKLDMWIIWQTFRAERSALTRLPVYYAAIRMFQEKPISGWGYGNFDRYDRQFQQRVGNFAYYYGDRASHNLYLTLLSEQGMTGLFLYLLPAIWWLVQTRKNYAGLPKNGFGGRKLLILLWAVLLSHVVVNNFSNMRVVFGLGMWWLTLGLIANLIHSNSQIGWSNSGAKSYITSRSALPKYATK